MQNACRKINSLLSGGVLPPGSLQMWFSRVSIKTCASLTNSVIRAKTSTSAPQATLESLEKKKKMENSSFFFLIHHSNLFFFWEGVIIQTVDHLFDLHRTDLSLICFKSVYVRTTNMWHWHLLMWTTTAPLDYHWSWFGVVENTWISCIHFNVHVNC